MVKDKTGMFDFKKIGTHTKKTLALIKQIRSKA